MTSRGEGDRGDDRSTDRGRDRANGNRVADGSGAEDRGFARLVDAILDDYYASYPQDGVAAGLHEYDGRITDLADGAIQDRKAALRRQGESLRSVDVPSLSPGAQLDHACLVLHLENELYRLEDEGCFRRNPMDYMDLIDASIYLVRDYAPLSDRAAALARHLGQVPRVLEQARQRLEIPVPRPFAGVALDMLAGTEEYLVHALDEALAPLEDDDPGLLDEVRAAREGAREAVADFTRYLGELDENGSLSEDFALGSHRFERMLATGEGVRVDPERLLALGEADLARNKAAFESVAAAVDPDLPPAEVMARQVESHPAADEVVERTRDVLDELRTFVEEYALVTIPEGGDLRVAPAPPFARRGFAMLDAPGGFEDATETYYYVTLPDDGWDEERQHEWLTKFAPGRLQAVSMHEAWPGHFVHHMHVRRIESRVRRAFGAYSSWEAWAHYAEQLMIEAGFRPDDLSLRLAQLGESLLRNVRLVVAISLHTAGMTEEEAAERFQREAFLAPAPAREEARRGTFDPGYLNYTLGRLMLLKLREDLRQQAKNADERFELRQFHDTFLSFGAPPLPLVREAMLGTAEGVLP